MYTEKWVKENTPEKDGEVCWIAVNTGDKVETYSEPCKYNSDKKCWVGYDGKEIPKNDVVAYYRVVKPKPCTTIGHGTGFYIKTICNGQETIYGFGLQPAEWVGVGYKTLDRAKSAARRLAKLDREEGYSRSLYEVVDGNGNSAWVLEQK